MLKNGEVLYAHTKKWFKMIFVILLSYALAALFYFSGYKPDFHWTYLVFVYAYMWIPGIVAFFQARREKINLPFKFSVVAYLKTAFSSFVLVMASIFLVAHFYNWQSFFIADLKNSVFSLFLYFVFGVVLGPFAVLGQEMMWRGVLHEKLKSLKPLKASTMIGLAWGIWYIPLVLLGFNYPGHPFAGSLMILVLTISLSPLLFYYRERAKSIMIPTAFHAVLNALFGITFFVFEDPNYFIAGPTGIIAIGLYAIASCCAIKKLAKG